MLGYTGTTALFRLVWLLVYTLKPLETSLMIISLLNIPNRLMLLKTCFNASLLLVYLTHNERAIISSLEPFSHRLM